MGQDCLRDPSRAFDQQMPTRQTQHLVIAADNGPERSQDMGCDSNHILFVSDGL
ncbi:MAG TPA: hypothetical protein VNB54_07275 [Alphaproteobacteria bacterium]|nr:hypothetical protein [Alphaproteobacteria bacterium]